MTNISVMNINKIVFAKSPYIRCIGRSNNKGNYLVICIVVMCLEDTFRLHIRIQTNFKYRVAISSFPYMENEGLFVALSVSIR